jgi:trimeric autotransporter adhesin
MKTKFYLTKKVFFLLAIAIFSFKNSFAQNTFPATGSAGIGTAAPNAAALLEVKSTTKGILIPRMTLTQRNAIASPVVGLMIFQTNSTPGFYYYSGTTWTAVSPAAGANRNLSNLLSPVAFNSNLTPDSNNKRNIGSTTLTWHNGFFGGTLKIGAYTLPATDGTNGQVLTTNGTGNVSWKTAGGGGGSSQWTTSGSNIFFNTGNVGIGTSTPTAKLDVAGNINLSTTSSLTDGGTQALKINYAKGNFWSGNGGLSNTSGTNNTSGGSGTLNANTSGSGNTANGSQAMFSNTTGTSNTANGFNAMFSNTSGGNNTATGVASLNANTTGNDNSALGVNSLLNNTSGIENSALGSGALFANTTGNFNTASGYLTLGANTTGSDNTAYGFGALNFSTTASNNTAVGFQSLFNTTVGTGNVAVGYQTLFTLNSAGTAANTAVGFQSLFNNTEPGNTAMGYQAAFSNTTGLNNTADGFKSLFFNTSGVSNTAIGSESMFGNTSGGSNTALGTSTMFSNSTGSSNVAIGTDASFFNTTGFNNTAVGNLALQANVTGAFNTAVGCTALLNNTGSSNTAVGEKAMQGNTAGGFNCALGSGALQNGTSGSDNTALGFQSMFNTIGADNTAIGYQSGFNDALGSQNIFIGSKSGISCTNGSFNVFIGFQAGNANTDGSFNTYLGFDAGLANVTGTSNTYLGYLAGSTATGSDNTYIGYQTNPQGSVSGVSNSGSFGFNSIATAANQIFLGNSTVAEIASFAQGIFGLSDGRYKKNIKENVLGLDFINKLRPVTYTLDVDGINKSLGIVPDQTMTQAAAERESQICDGFIAQEVEKAANETNYNFSGIHKPQNAKDFYALNYSAFVVPLVKAVQELSTQNDLLKSQNDSMKSRLSVVEQKLNSATTSGMVKVSIDNADQTTLLGQNIPNPFDHSTLIPFRIPSDCHDASIAIVETATGKIIHLIPVSCTETQLSFDAGSLASGNYSYSLYVDGKLVETKQMMLTK